MDRSYSELIQIPNFIDRYKYLRQKQIIGDVTFGGHRPLNQTLYKSPEWRRIRHLVIARDRGCDLAHPDYEIRDGVAYIHHINPITIEDIQNRDPKVLDPSNLITVSFNTHQAIHYGSEDMLQIELVERYPGDTCPWKKGVSQNDKFNP